MNDIIKIKVKVDKLSFELKIPQQQEEYIRKSIITINNVIDDLRKKYFDKDIKSYEELLVMALIKISGDLHVIQKKVEDDNAFIKDKLSKLL